MPASSLTTQRIAPPPISLRRGVQFGTFREYRQWRDAFDAQLAGFLAGRSRSARTLALELIALVGVCLHGPDAGVMLTALRAVARANTRSSIAYAVFKAVRDEIPAATCAGLDALSP